MAGGQEKWYFIKDQLQNSPSRKCGLDADKELAYRQQAANLIQDMGQRLQVSQLCINTAIVYMHRFYAFHSFTQFHRNAIAAAALFLAAKVEEQPRKLEYVIKVAHVCLHRGEGVNALTSSEQYQEQAQDLVFNENVLLQTLGFDVAIDHPHTHVLQTCHLVKAPKDLAQTSYFMASNSLHLTTMCLQYKPTVVACFCIHLASKWSNWQIPQSHEGRHWFSYVDRTVTTDLLERLTAEFLHIFDKCPSRLKKKMMTMSNASGSSPNAPHPSNSAVASPYDRKKESHSLANSDEIDKSFDKEYERERRRQQAPGGYVPATAQPNQPQPQKIDFNLYREKREREERERRQQALQRPGNPPPSSRPTNQPPPNHHHHRPPNQHKAHHSWPHKPPHHKPPHERHRQPIPPSQSQSQSQSQTQPPSQSQPQAQSQPPQEIPQRTRPPSLFSPENVTPAATAAHPRRPHPPQPNPPPKPKPPQESRPPIPPQTDNQKPPSPKKRPDAASAVREMQPPAILSPFSSPKEKRQRLPSNSEPELVPVVKKIDETPGYENIVRDSQRGNAIKTHQSHQRPEIRKPEGRTLNGIETDPTLVSNLLKESLAKPAPITVATEKKSPLEIKKEPVIEISKPEPEPHNNVSQQNPPTEDSHKHKKDKKKKDKHKHKDRDKSKDERKKHKKDKDKKKEPSPQQESDGLKITIPREKLSASPGLKIKIPKERLAAPPPPPQQQQQLPQTSGLKIKISKDVLENSRKRTNMDGGPPQKMARPELPKVGNWNIPPPYRPPLPYYMVQPPPPFYYGMMDGYFFNPMFQNHNHSQSHNQNQSQPPLPAMPPPPVPPPPPE